MAEWSETLEFFRGTFVCREKIASASAEGKIAQTEKLKRKSTQKVAPAALKLVNFDSKKIILSSRAFSRPRAHTKLESTPQALSTQLVNMLKINNIEAIKELRTPLYYYDMDLFRRSVQAAVTASQKWGIQAHYAVKANVEERLLRHISSMGLGADCVSWNEAQSELETGFEAKKIVFAGVGKSDWEIEPAVKSEIAMFNCESLQEIKVINEIAERLGIRARFSARINPGVDAHTHRYITTGTHENKFGIAPAEFDQLIELTKECKWLDFSGLHFHIGSQIT